MNTKPKSAKPAGCTFEQKWGEDPFTALGHTQIPNALLRYASRLMLAPDECWLITCILLFKRSPADPFPGQSTLTEMYGRSVDTVQRVIKSIRAKGLLETHHKRSDLGHFDHIVYDFMPLRAALNECYYQDHPQERPKCSRMFPMPNKSISNKPDLSYKSAMQSSAMPHSCGMAERTRQM